MITLRNRLEDYLKVRRALGWQLVQPAADLRQFVSFLEQEGASTITRGMALRWAKDRVNVNPAFWARRLSFVRLFAKYVHGFDPRTEAPPFWLLPHCYRWHRPYIYTDVEILRLMQAVERIRWRTPRMGRWTYPTLFGLWACTGLRSTEAYKLNRKDVDLDGGVQHSLRLESLATGRRKFSWNVQSCVPSEDHALSTAQTANRNPNVSVHTDAAALSNDFPFADTRILHCFPIEEAIESIVHRSTRPPKLSA